MQKKCILLMVVFFSSFLLGCTTQFYVSPDGDDTNSGTLKEPFASIQRAQRAVQEKKAKGACSRIEILLRSGRYELQQPLRFTKMDSGSKESRIVYRSYKNENVIVSGGKRIDGWKMAKGNLWYALVPEGMYFRDLYANGKRQTRARFPNADESPLKLEKIEESKSFLRWGQYVLDANFPGGNLENKDAEMVLEHFWSMSRQRIVSSEERRVVTANPAGWVGHFLTEATVGRPVFLEHAKEFIDQAGEWYLDRYAGKLYYQAATDENPNKMEFFAPVVEQLLIVKGEKNEPIRNLHFEGIHFEHAAWQLPLIGYNGQQACAYGSVYIKEPSYMIPAAVHCEYVTDSSFKKCEVSHTGASGIAFGAGCKRNKILGCEFGDIGGNGIVIGWRAKADDPPRRCFENDWIDQSDAPAANQISHNHIHHCGQVQFGAVGYFEAFVTDTVCSHNLIHDLPYTGISTGYRWDSVPSTQRGSRIEFNEIHHVMQKLRDGAAIYTLGYQPDTVVRNNYIHHTKSHGIYADQFSAEIVFEKNVVWKAAVHGFQQNQGAHNTIRNNFFISCGTYALHRNLATENAPAYIFEKNIVVVDRFEPTEITWYQGKGEDKAGFLFEKESCENMKMDHNLYWDARGKEPKFSGMSLEEFQAKRNQDKHSIVGDPKFTDIEKGDFKLEINSPAKQLDIEPIDLSAVGPQGEYRIEY